MLKEKPKVVLKYKIANPELETDSQSLTQSGNFLTLAMKLIYMYVFNFVQTILNIKTLTQSVKV